MATSNTWVFERKITSGNLLIIGTIIVTVILAWARLEAHVSSSDTHPSKEKRQEEILTTTVSDRNAINELIKHIETLEKKQDRNTELLYEIKGRLGK